MEEQYNQKRIKPPFWQHDYHVLTRLYRILNSYAQKYIVGKSKIIMDYGCGTLPYKRIFSHYAAKYIGVDIGKNRKASILIEEQEKVPLPNASVDIIISTQVLEHVRFTDFYLNECQRLLKRGGLLFLSTHGVWPYHRYPADFHRWTKSGLIEEIERCDFVVLEITSILGPFATATQFTLILLAERLIERHLLATVFLAFLSIIGNSFIWIEDKIIPAEKESDSSLYILCGKKK